jgi:MFS family permease
MTAWLMIVRRGLPLLAIGFLVDFAFIFVFLIVLQSYLPESFGASPSIAGFALGAFGAAKLGSQVAGGVVFDLLGARRTLALGALLQFVANLAIVPFVHIAPWLVVGAAVVYGLGSSLCWPPIYSLMTASFHDSERARLSSALTLASALALALGLAAGAALNRYVSFDAAMLVPITAALIALAVAARLPRYLMASHVDETAHTSLAALSGVIRSVPRLMFSVLVFAESFSLGALSTGYRAYGRDVLHVSLVREAALLAPAAGLGALLVPVGGLAADRFGRKLFLSIGFAIAGACLVALARWHNASFFLVMTTIAASGFALAIPSVSASMMSLAGPSTSRGGVIGWFMTMDGLGQFVGPTLAGAVLVWHDANAVLVLVGVMFVIVGGTASLLRLPHESPQH